MHIHILGICGTFMGGIAQLASALGHKVTGSDANVYPPMSTQLEQAGIVLTEGWDPAQLEPEPDMVVIGNALSRGNPAVEAVLDRGLRYTSGPQWLAEHVLHGRWVLGVAGTHGKTTTASMLAWILEHAGLQPGFLIGGVPKNFGVSARNGGGSFFVVEADEYDTAFFDKRSKFVHYRPRTLVMNNLEYDHADIFEDLEAIQRQFHHLVRTVPSNGLIVMPLNEGNLHEVLDMGCWTEVEYLDPFIEASWHAVPHATDNSVFDVVCDGEIVGRVDWPHSGRHNLANALAALAAARHAGVPAAEGVAALNAFEGVKRRMELRGEVGDIRVYDDFAHHPTAIGSTLAGLRARVGEGRILAVLEPRSNTMRLGVHARELPTALDIADQVFLFDDGNLGWQPSRVLSSVSAKLGLFGDIGDLVATLVTVARPGDTIVVMSNGGFGGIHQKLLDALKAAVAA
jgi:UDP-N-acetylmuramate: L-alanyl-gamma-D-glutamyl-meso-diaminopimelate ligase